jgi:hypothetical protein
MAGRWHASVTLVPLVMAGLVPAISIPDALSGIEIPGAQGRG